VDSFRKLEGETYKVRYSGGLMPTKRFSV